jgi:hypothetical protein
VFHPPPPPPPPLLYGREEYCVAYDAENGTEEKDSPTLLGACCVCENEVDECGGWMSTGFASCSPPARPYSEGEKEIALDPETEPELAAHPEPDAASCSEDDSGVGSSGDCGVERSKVEGRADAIAPGDTARLDDDVDGEAEEDPSAALFVGGERSCGTPLARPFAFDDAASENVAGDAAAARSGDDFHFSSWSLRAPWRERLALERRADDGVRRGLGVKESSFERSVREPPPSAREPPPAEREDINSVEAEGCSRGVEVEVAAADQLFGCWCGEATPLPNAGKESANEEAEEKDGALLSELWLLCAGLMLGDPPDGCSRETGVDEAVDVEVERKASG